MKITKTKQVVTEEIEVSPGTYYFEIALRSNKMVIEETDEDGYTKYRMETLNNFANIYSIRVFDDECTSEDVPYEFKQFILGEAGKEITEEDYIEERRDVISRLG
jgi:hypothetical protein